MFNNMKRLISLVLPVVAMTMTSCGNETKTITYEQMRRFTTENYDAHALDTVPAIFSINLNKCQTDVVVNYTTPEGGQDSSNIAFGFNGIHFTFKDQYAVLLSSTIVDTIEKYYSDFIAFAISVVDDTPLDLSYQLLGNNCSKIDLATSTRLVGSVFVKLLQMVTGALDIAASAAGYIPDRYVDTYVEGGYNPCTNLVTKTIFEGIMALAQSIANMMSGEKKEEEKKLLTQKEESKVVDVTKENTKKIAKMIIGYMDNVALTVLNSSKANGEVFDLYITTDSYGFINTLDFNFSSSFEVSGLAKYKEYATNEPEEGDQPLPSGSYHFSMSGSFDFDIDISSKFAN